MHIYFSGIGGAGIGPLALIAHQAGFTVSGSDRTQNRTIEYLREHGLRSIHTGQEYDQIAEVHAKQPIDWLVHTSALNVDQPDAPELRFCAEHNIRTSLRDEFLTYFLDQKHLKMIAVAGTHGKTTTTAMVIWLLKQLDIPVSYSVGAKLSFGDMGAYDPASEYFVYEADEYNRNFLAFQPCISLITGIDWDHPDIYPTREDYNAAFGQFLRQSEQAVVWQDDARRLNITAAETIKIIEKENPAISNSLHLAGVVNRQDAWLVAAGISALFNKPLDELTSHLNRFPGISRRFEQIAANVYSDYAHTPPKIRGALQLAHEVADGNVVVVYEGLHNMRQHFIRDELVHLFDDIKQLYIVPSYLAREDPNLPVLSPSDIKDLLSPKAQEHTQLAGLNNDLKEAIKQHAANNDLVLCLTAGGGNSLDEWLRAEFQHK